MDIEKKSRLANVEYFFNVNVFLNVNINVSILSINQYSFKYICVMLLKTSFLLRQLFCSVKFDLIQLISQHQTVGRDFNS